MPFKKKGTGASKPKRKSKITHIASPEQSKHEFEKSEHYSKHHLEKYNKPHHETNPSTGLKVMMLGHH